MWSNRESKGSGLWRVVFPQQRVLAVMIAFLFFCTLPSVPVIAASEQSVPAHSVDKKYFDIFKSIDLLGEVYREVSTNYVDTINVSGLMYAGIDGMLRTLDPYTVFLDENDSDELDEMTSGQYVGIGISIASLDDEVFVSSVVDGYAAAKAGIRVGDSIVSINNERVRKMSLDKVKALIKGVAGTPLHFQLERQGLPPFSARLTREEVRLSTVSYSGIFGAVGYIEMKSFGARSTADLREALQGLVRQAAEQHLPLKGIILDLRNNPGGLLTVAVDVSSLFVPSGSAVVSIRGRSAKLDKSFVTETPPLDAQLPLAVLINTQSASAAEIVAGAMQDLDRGIVIGERSYGKGLVQSVVRLSYNTAVKVTTSKYYTPSGRLIQKESNNAVSELRKVLSTSHEGKASEVFYTKGKRKVYGGGGIMPDIQLSEQATSPYLSELRKRGLLFLFSSAYRSTHPLIPSQPIDRPALMALFADFLRGKKFVYTSESERRFNELKESMKKVQPENTERSQSLTLLLQEIEQFKKQEIQKESASVAQELEVEVLRHYDERMARKAELDHDLVVKKAVELLSDSLKYAQILHP